MWLYISDVVEGSACRRARCAAAGPFRPVEDFANAAAGAMRFQVGVVALDVDIARVTESLEDPTRCLGRGRRRWDLVTAEDSRGPICVELVFEVVDVVREFVAGAPVERRGVTRREDRSLLGRRVKQAVVSLQRGMGLVRELDFLVVRLILSQDGQHPLLEVDVCPAEAVATIVARITENLGRPNAAVRDQGDECPVADSLECYRETRESAEELNAKIEQTDS